MTPLITILTPTLNASRYLAGCLATIHAQTHPPDRIEHLVIDGGSTDGTQALVARLSPASRLIDSDDRSIYEAMNTGLREARGDIVVWLNADDGFYPDALNDAVRAFQRCPDAEVAISHYEKLFAGGARFFATRADALERARSGRRHNFVNWLALFIKTETLREAGGFSTEYRIVGDTDMWWRIAARNPPLQTVHTGGVAGQFRVHPDSLSHGKGVQSARRETARLAWQWLRRAGVPLGIRVVALRQLVVHGMLCTGNALAMGLAGSRRSS